MPSISPLIVPRRREGEQGRAEGLGQGKVLLNSHNFVIISPSPMVRGSASSVTQGGSKGRGHNSGIDLRTRVANSINSTIAGYLHEWYEHAASRHDKLQFVYRRVSVPQTWLYPLILTA